MLVSAKKADGEPGAVDLSDHRLQVACAQNTWIEITELQMEGKKRMTASDFLRGAGLRSGIRLG
jgi:methionyl-tRNA formyltransferase